MKLSPSSPASADLTYCTNIHPGERWDEVRRNVETYATAVRAKIAPDRPFSLGLRLSAAAAETLAGGDERWQFRAWLDTAGMYVRTINGFPFGTFHGTAVKENVYRPDWSESARVDYTLRLADLLSDLLPEGASGNISTVPGSFRPRATPSAAAAMVRHLALVAAALWRRRAQSGRRIVLALEPEPECLLETTEEVIAFLQDRCFRSDGLDAFCHVTGLDRGAGEAALREHLGVCVDLCHAAVEYEAPRTSVNLPARAGIALAKVQISSGLRLATLDAERLRRLREFADPVYLHQVVARTSRGLERHLDLEPALRTAAAAPERWPDEEWRIHFHVPVFSERVGAFETTQSFVEAALTEIRTRQACDCLEVETYTWDVLPPEFRPSSVVEAISRELQWVVDQWST